MEVRARRFLGNEACFFSRYIKRVNSYLITILTALPFAHDQSTIESILLPELTMIRLRIMSFMECDDLHTAAFSAIANIFHTL